MTRQCWDRHSIQAEVQRRGYTLTRVALEAGLEASSCRQALIRRVRSGEEALARFLGVSVIELWPERYRLTSSSDRSTASPRGRTSQKHPLVSDIGDAA